MRLLDDGGLYWKPTGENSRLLDPDDAAALGMFMTFMPTDVIEQAMQAGVQELVSRAHGEAGGDVLMAALAKRGRTKDTPAT